MVRRSDTQWLMGDDRFIELMNTLSHPDERWAQPDQPDILLALDELIAWTRDSRAYDERLHESGWASVTRDFLVALDALGTKTKHAVQSHLDGIRPLCQPNVGGNEALRAKLASEAMELRQTLGTKPVLMAAWVDLNKVLGREESSINTVYVRRDTFWAIVRAADRNAFELSRSLTFVLSGDPMHAQWARLELGEIHRIDRHALAIDHSTPPIDPKQRLELVVKLLSVEPASSAHTVWFCFRHAGLTAVKKGFGSIELFEARSLRAHILKGPPFQEGVPAELHGIPDVKTIPDERDAVMASVDLGTGIFSDPVQAASKRIDAFVGMSTIGYLVPWERIPGFLHIRDGRLIASQSFMLEDQKIDSPLALDAIAAQITNMAPRVVAHLPVSDQSMQDIIDALDWWRPGLGQPTAASVILNVRIIELVASRADETSWTTYLEKRSKSTWIRASILDPLHRALHIALTRGVAPEAQSIQRDIFLEASKYEDGQQLFSIRTAARRLDTIIGFTPPNQTLGRDLRTIRQRTSNTQAITKWCAELERQWGESLHRLERVRNAIAHGGPFTERAVQLMQPFSQRLAVWALSESVEGFLDGKTVVKTHEDLTDQWRGWRLSVQRATSLDETFDNVPGA
jgi:hypothetical protein